MTPIHGSCFVLPKDWDDDQDVPTPPNYPSRYPRIPFNRDPKALNGGTFVAAC